MQSKTLITTILVLINITATLGQASKFDSTDKRCFVGSTFFMLGNFIPQNRPDFVQLNLGYRLSPKNVVSIEFKTWKYAWPLGIPYGKSFEAPIEKYPGYIREFGIALTFQHFWWKGLYNAIHIMNAKQNFYNENGDKIDVGYQMFNTYRLGYHFKLFKNKFFIEPSIALIHRPIQSKMPNEFAQLNNKWPIYFIGEPGLHFGFNF